MKSAARAAKLADDAARKRAERAAKAQKIEAEKKRKREARKKTKKETHGGEVRWAVGNDLVPAHQVSCVTGRPLPPPRDASPVTVVRAPAKYLARSKRELAENDRREREAAKRVKTQAARPTLPVKCLWVPTSPTDERAGFNYYVRARLGSRGCRLPLTVLRAAHDVSFEERRAWQWTPWAGCRTLDQVAEALGTSKSTICRLVNNRRSLPALFREHMFDLRDRMARSFSACQFWKRDSMGALDGEYELRDRDELDFGDGSALTVAERLADPDWRDLPRIRRWQKKIAMHREWAQEVAQDAVAEAKRVARERRKVQKDWQAKGVPPDYSIWRSYEIDETVDYVTVKRYRNADGTEVPESSNPHRMSHFDRRRSGVRYAAETKYVGDGCYRPSEQGLVGLCAGRFPGPVDTKRAELLYSRDTGTRAYGPWRQPRKVEAVVPCKVVDMSHAPEGRVQQAIPAGAAKERADADARASSAAAAGAAKERAAADAAASSAAAAAAAFRALQTPGASDAALRALRAICGRLC